MRALHALREVQQPVGRDTVALEGAVLAVFAGPHALAHFERVLQQLVAGGQRGGERHTEPIAFLLVVAGAHAEPGAAAAQHVEGGHCLGQHRGVAEMRAGHDGQQPHPAGACREIRQRGVRLETGRLRPAHHRV
jgi:hypothetical protein